MDARKHLSLNHGKDETLTQEEKWGETTCSRDRGNRARMLGAALSVARPDLFDVKCSRSAPPSDFSYAQFDTPAKDAIAEWAETVSASV